MQGSPSRTPARTRRFIALMRYLMRNPWSVPTYLREATIASRGVLDRGLPWFSFRAIEVLETLVDKRSIVFEWGSGGSTVYFAMRAKHVYAVEHDKLWARKVSAQCDTRDLLNVSLFEAAADFSSVELFLASPFARVRPPERPDIIIIDSYDFDTGFMLRPALFRIAERLLGGSGVIVLDDSWRYPTLKPNIPYRFDRDYPGLGPARRSLTSTRIIVY